MSALQVAPHGCALLTPSYSSIFLLPSLPWIQVASSRSFFSAYQKRVCDPYHSLSVAFPFAFISQMVCSVFYHSSRDNRNSDFRSSRPMHNSAREVSWPLEVEPAYEVSDADNADLESDNRLVLHSDETLGKTMQSCAERALQFSLAQRQMSPALQRNSYPRPFSGRRFEDEPSKGPGRPMHPDITRGEKVQTSSRPPSGRSERCRQPSPVLQVDYYKPSWYQHSVPWPPTQLLGEVTQASSFLSRRKFLDIDGNTTEKRSYPTSCTMAWQPRRVKSLELSSGKVAVLDRHLGQAKKMGPIPRKPKMRNGTTPGAPWLDAARTFEANLQLLKAAVTDSATLDISRHQMQTSNCKDNDVLKLRRISDENTPKAESDNGEFTEFQQLESEIGLVPQTGICDSLKISSDCKASDNISSVQMITSVDSNCKALGLQGNGVEVLVDSHGKSLKYGKIFDSSGIGKAGHKIKQCAELQTLKAEVKSVSQIASTVSRPQLSTLAEVQCEASEALKLQRNRKNTAGSNGLACSLEEVLIVDNLATAKAVVSRLRGDYNDFVHAWDTEGFNAQRRWTSSFISKPLSSTDLCKQFHQAFSSLYWHIVGNRKADIIEGTFQTVVLTGEETPAGTPQDTVWREVEQALGSPLDSGPQAPSPKPYVIVISGPSGVGKDAIINRLKEVREDIHFVVTATTRPKRPGEVDGKDYFFLDEAEFQSMIQNDELLEYALVYGDYKGIPKQQVRQCIAQGKDVVLRIDVQGAATVRSILGSSAVFIFLVAESEVALVKRLIDRKTETVDNLLLRIRTARDELERMGEFDYVIVNADGQLEKSVSLICSIIDAEKARVHKRVVQI